jgi:hypothetical protein
MDDSLGARSKIQAILSDTGMIQASHLDECSVIMRPNTPLRMCGAASLAMVQKNVREMKDVERYAKLFEFYSNTQGVKELWALLDALGQSRGGGARAR